MLNHIKYVAGERSQKLLSLYFGCGTFFHAVKLYFLSTPIYLDMKRKIRIIHQNFRLHAQHDSTIS